MNPILGHEWRTRWRGHRAFALLLGYAVLLCFAMIGIYGESVDGTASGIAGTARAGHSLFMMLTWMQLAAWLLLSPGLTAGGIAGEREKGLLESLQLSPLMPRQIITGKLSSSLLFVLLVIFISQPVVGICFLLGGVSEAEYLTSVGLQLLTALFGATIGIFFSAWNRRAGAALRKAFAVVILWSIASLVSLITVFFPGINSFWRTVGFVTVFSHPASGALFMDDSFPATFATLPGPLVFFAGQPWLFTLLFQAVAICLALYSASRAVRRPLPEQYWIEAKKNSQHRDLPSTHNATQVSQTERSSASLWWELPFARLKFNNPLLQRELRGKFRMRAVPSYVLAVEALLALAVAYFYVRAIFWAIFEPDSRSVIWWVIAFTALFILMVAVPVMGAGAFTRERESGTFESLFLSVLSNREVVIAKIGAPLLSCVLFSTPLLPLLLLCIRTVNYQPNWGANGISISQAIGTVLVLTASAFSCGSFGMLISWYCKRTSAAIGWTLGGLFTILAVLPLLWQLIATPSGALWILHPMFGLAAVSDPRNIDYALHNTDPIVISALFFLLHSVIGYVLLVLLQHAMINRAREADKK
jgi:ABC-type transport system involved in multi-copper enzyme maturation permease subunit